MIIIKEVRAATKQGKKSLRRIYDFIVEYVTINLYAPNIRDICDGVGLTSTATVYYYLEVLADKGLIEIKKHSSRAIKLVVYHLEKDKE